MAGTLYPIPSDQLAQQRKDTIALSLTNFSTITVSEIALGSRIVIAGAVVGFEADESMGNWAGVVAGDVYCYIDSVALTSSYSNTAPTWNTELQGWYDAGNTKRCYARLYKTVGGDYTQKAIYTRSRGLLQTYYGLALNTGANGDQEIRFANDARLVYDDSDNVIDNEGMAYRGAFEYAYQDAVLLKTQTGAGSSSFYIKKPITAYITIAATNDSSDFYIYQNAGWRSIATIGSGNIEYKLQLNPGYYRLTVRGTTASPEGKLYCTGVFSQDTVVASEIVT